MSEGTNETAAAESKDIYFVLDTNCTERHPKRSHEIIIGEPPNHEIHSYTFVRTEPLAMEKAHALKFLHDEAWEVTDSEGNRVRPITKGDPAAARGRPGHRAISTSWPSTRW